ncbi:MAG: hypothetical protein LBG58_03485 [Planctomycetaceae bacterium]|jgi:hypothetical protein|nr:hypothetical protein [Planctomycetaceae bacterium]
MENNELTTTSDFNAVSSHFGRNFGFLGWILFFGLILFIAGTLADSIDWNIRTINRILYLIDPRCWSLLLVPILWAAVFWLVTDFLCCFDFIRRRCRWIRLTIVLGVISCLLLLSGWTARKIRLQIYFGIYMAYIVGPIADYIVTGNWSWKMLIAPVIAGIIIVFLLRIIIKHRRKKL